ncbi:GLEYA domain-containing protein [Hypoxylon sp. NC1633]|nr:GLEYA domain-containing protein [Hypoxylon sp. NC1633]
MLIVSTISKLLYLATGALVAASPVANPPTKLECVVVKVVVDILNGLQGATPFCSSYLQIPTVTKTATATSFPTTTTTRTTTTTGTNTITADTKTVTEHTTTTVTSCDPRVQKRAAAATTKRITISLPSALSTYAGAQLSTACGCLSIPTPSTTVTTTKTQTPVVTSVITTAGTTTVTPTTTVTVTATATAGCQTPPTCRNQGIQWAEYPNTQGPNTGALYSSFDPTVYKQQDPSISGVANTIGGIYTAGPGDISVYGSSQQFPGDDFALNHRGYLFAPETGTYTITVPGADDVLFVWWGPVARSGWTRANANLVLAYGTPSTSRTVDLVAGQYLPLRMVYGQDGGLANFQISVAAPDGTVFIDSNTANSPYVVRFSCDGTSAPPYVDWGSES